MTLKMFNGNHQRRAPLARPLHGFVMRFSSTLSLLSPLNLVDHQLNNFWNRSTPHVDIPYCV